MKNAHHISPPGWRLKITFFVRLTGQNAKILTLLSHKTEKSRIPSHLRGRSQRLFGIFLENDSNKNSCRFIFYHCSSSMQRCRLSYSGFIICKIKHHFYSMVHNMRVTSNNFLSLFIRNRVCRLSWCSAHTDMWAESNKLYNISTTRPQFSQWLSQWHYYNEAISELD